MQNKLVPIERDGQRVITTDLLAQVYETDTNNIVQNFKRNKSNFKEGLHYFLLQGDDLRAFKREVTDSHFAVAPNVNQLYLWTERGANRHCKILDTPKAWEQFDNLEETYFLVKEQRKQQARVNAGGQEKRPALSSVNMAMKLQTEAAKAAGMAPEYILAALAKAYDPYGIAVPADCLPEAEKLYECEEIARELGILSESRKPHGQAVAAIIKLVGADESEKKVLPFSKDAYSNVTVKYKRSVLDKVRGWLADHQYPSSVSGGRVNYRIFYKSKEAMEGQ